MKTTRAMKTIPGRYQWTNSKGVPGLDRMEIGEIDIPLGTPYTSDSIGGRHYPVVLPDGKTVYAKGR